MAKPAWKPWHKVVELRDDLRSGNLPLHGFAADLYNVAMGKADPVYTRPKDFFALTYPTFNLRELAKDVVLRLAGKNEKAVRQLQLTYGGGKTHALITLYHLVTEPSKLPNLPSVREFTSHIGIAPPKSRVVVMPFDKLDTEKGMEVLGPKGEKRWLKQPWSVLAFQIAGAEGLKLLHADDKDAERETAPAENLLADLLAYPGKGDIPTLVLIDEVLMYARGKVGIDPAWRARLVDFFQYLTQAVVKAPRCALVASLLATDPKKSDDLGKEITQELFAIFRREQEEGVQPVLKEDVAEVLRRRFFDPDSVKDKGSFRPHVVAAVKAIAELDETTRRDVRKAEERFLESYPFHPDLTDVFYSKWTNLEGFQRTRGILRTFALALRDAEAWDEAPLVSVNVFLGKPDAPGLSEAARELAHVAATEQYEGRRQEWTAILEGELAKARRIQSEAARIRCREIEGAVFAIFLHSQPIGQKALTRELLLLLGATRPDKIELEKALRAWAEESWFLDEEGIQGAESGGDPKRALPKTWRLGSKPNLRQMHHDACARVSPDLVETRLLDEVGRHRRLNAGAEGAGARVHKLPARPRDIEDDGEFHFAILGPAAASDPGRPSAEAKKFIEETTGPDRPRIYRNSIVLAVPSPDGLEVARQRIRDYMGWEEVKAQLRDQPVDPIREGTLSGHLNGSLKKIPEAIEQAYCIVVAVSAQDEIEAFKVTVGEDSLFAAITHDKRARIQEQAIDAEALLPDGPFNHCRIKDPKSGKDVDRYLWSPKETSRKLKDLVGAFAQFPHLPKMIGRTGVFQTFSLGAKEGRFVLRLTRPDRSEKTFWLQEPGDSDIKEPGIEVVLPEAASLSEISPSLLSPGRLPGLWARTAVLFKDLGSYFSGKHTAKIKKQGHEEPLAIPKAERQVLEAAVNQAVRDGLLWLTSGPASVLGEEIPAGLVNDDATLQAPPPPVPATDVLPKSLSEAWGGETTTALAIAAALSKKAGKTLPWATVREAIDGAMRSRMLERTADSGAWPCGFPGAQSVKLRVPKSGEVPAPTKSAEPQPRPGVKTAEAVLTASGVQNLAEQIAQIHKAAMGHELVVRVRVELGGQGVVPDSVVAKVNTLLGEVSEAMQLK